MKGEMVFVPNGFDVMPLKATDFMLEMVARRGFSHDDASYLWERMAAARPSIPMVADEVEGSTNPTIESIKEMMRDPRYWKHKDPDFIKKVFDANLLPKIF